MTPNPFTLITIKNIFKENKKCSFSPRELASLSSLSIPTCLKGVSYMNEKKLIMVSDCSHKSDRDTKYSLTELGKEDIKKFFKEKKVRTNFIPNKLTLSSFFLDHPRKEFTYSYLCTYIREIEHETLVFNTRRNVDSLLELFLEGGLIKTVKRGDGTTCYTLRSEKTNRIKKLFTENPNSDFSLGEIGGSLRLSIRILILKYLEKKNIIEEVVLKLPKTNKATDRYRLRRSLVGRI